MERNWQNFLDWLKHHLLVCPFKSAFGIDCPGCGLQRSVLALLKGDLISSFHYYPATIPMMALFIFTCIHIRYKFNSGAGTIKIAFVAIAGLILIQYIYKIYTHQLI